MIRLGEHGTGLLFLRLVLTSYITIIRGQGVSRQVGYLVNAFFVFWEECFFWGGGRSRGEIFFSPPSAAKKSQFYVRKTAFFFSFFPIFAKPPPGRVCTAAGRGELY